MNEVKTESKYFYRAVIEKYSIRISRLRKSILGGTFSHYSLSNKKRLFTCLARYERQLLSWGFSMVSATALLMPGTVLAQAVPAGSEFQVNSWTSDHQFGPSVAMDSDGDFVVAWKGSQNGNNYDIYAQRYNSMGVALGSEFRVNTWTTNTQSLPSVAMDSDGDFVIAWNSYHQDGSWYNIYAQRYNSSGIPVGNEFRVNTITEYSQAFPRIAMDSDGDFVITWSNYYPDVVWSDIYAQRYDSSGNPLGSEFRVNTWTTHHQAWSYVAMDSDGDFVIAWHSYYQDGSSYDIYAQRFNSSGIPVGSEFLVNTWTTDIQVASSVAMDNDGDFIIAWLSGSQDGYGYGIYAQQYESSGAPVGSEFRVNTWTTSSQIRPSVDMDSDGDFVIAWESMSQDGSYYGIYAQQYENSGAPLGSEFRVNTWTTGSQVNPSVAMDSEGDFVIAWSSNYQDGSYYGIFAQRYQHAVLPVELTTFTGTATDTGNLLQWNTGSETHNAGFGIERSCDGWSFQTIGFVPGQGTVQSPHTYRFTDENPPSGLQYYRLRQVNMDGTDAFSEIIAILTTGHTETFALYPNPTADILYVRSQETEINLYNHLGQLVRHFMVTSETVALNISDIAPGLYWVESGDRRQAVVKL